MDKINVVVSCPIDTYSGYGARSRDFVKALINLEKYDVKILSQRWGNTRFGYLEDHKEYDLKDKIILGNLDTKPDVWIQVSVPNEFQAVGKYNIGLTAGIETTLCAKEWIEGCNRMNIVLTSSNHSKRVFENSKYEVKDQQGQLINTIELQTPVEVLFEGVDLEKYFRKDKSTFDLSSIPESFCYLFVGHWLQGAFGEDRKNIGYTIKSFLETFKNKPSPPALILKTMHATASIIDRELVLDKIDEVRRTVKGKLPNIYLIHGDLTDEEVNELYNHPKVKAMVSLTKGEGFGRPLLEFSIARKPIIASGWSGQVDFLDAQLSLLIGGSVDKVHQSALQNGIILPEAQWFRPDDAQVGNAYKEVYKQYKKHIVLAKKQGFKNTKEFSFDKMQELLGEILDKNLPEFPKHMPLNMPNVSLPKLNTI